MSGSPSFAPENETQVRPTFLRRKIVDPLKALLRQGITPDALALSLAIGITIGTFPIVGTTTVLCLVVALALRLNIAAIQLVNWFVYPVQIALLIPLVRYGERLFSAKAVPLTIADIEARFAEGLRPALSAYGRELTYAVGAWLTIAPVLAGLLYVALRPVLRRMAAAYRARAAAQDGARA